MAKRIQYETQAAALEALRNDRTIFHSGLSLAELEKLAEVVKAFAPGKPIAEGLELLLRQSDPQVALLPELERDRLPKQRPRKRDHAGERKVAKDKLAHAAADVRILRASDELEILQVAQALILCGLPYKRTGERQIERKARLADGGTVAVTFTAGFAGVDMPYGNDRGLLYFLIDKAIKTKNRFVRWNTALEFLQAMELSDGGNNFGSLRKRYERIRGLTIGIQRTSATADATVLMPVIRRSFLPTSIEVKAERRGQGSLRLTADEPYGVEFGEDFFADLQNFPALVPLELLRKTTRKPQLQDLCLFLHWRVFAAARETVIPWKSLVEQLWQRDQTTRRIKGRFNEAIAFLQAMWPELQAEVRPEGLWIAPPLNGRYLIPKGGAARRLSRSPHNPQERTR